MPRLFSCVGFNHLNQIAWRPYREDDCSDKIIKDFYRLIGTSVVLNDSPQSNRRIVAATSITTFNIMRFLPCSQKMFDFSFYNLFKPDVIQRGVSTAFCK